jgi:hypothetical protein
MSLPTLSLPSYELVIPSSKKKVKYRPFMVKEEKILLMALESEDEKQIADALESIIASCIITKGFKVQDLATFDIEYIFLNIRAKSVGEIIELLIPCPDDPETDVKVTIDIEQVNVEFEYGHTNKIKLDDNLWIEMKYPGIDTFANPQEDIDDSFKFVANSVAKIYNDEEVWDTNTTTEHEYIHFIEQLSSKQFAKLQKFFDTMPSLRHKLKLENPKTGFQFEYVVEGLSNFFV